MIKHNPWNDKKEFTKSGFNDLSKGKNDRHTKINQTIKRRNRLAKQYPQSGSNEFRIMKFQQINGVNTKNILFHR